MGIINAWVISPDTHSERRIDPHWTVGEFKGKLELITGVPVENQALTVLMSQTDSTVVATLDDDSKKLGFYDISDFQVIKVHDTNPSVSLTGQLTDVTQVDKFEITQEAYEERQDSVLAYKQRNKVGRFAPKEEPKPVEVPVDITVGSRCEVESSEPGLNKRGIVRFVGPTKFGSDGGIWVGIEYDEPFGKNDGSVKGEKYFECMPNYGVFVRPDKVRVGDYPPVDLDLDDEEM